MPRLAAVTIADLAAGSAGSVGVSSFAGGCVGSGPSTGGVSAGFWQVALTIATAAALRFRGGRLGRWA